MQRVCVLCVNNSFECISHLNMFIIHIKQKWFLFCFLSPLKQRSTPRREDASVKMTKKYNACREEFGTSISLCDVHLMNQDFVIGPTGGFTPNCHFGGHKRRSVTMRSPHDDTNFNDYTNGTKSKQGFLLFLFFFF